MYVRTSSHRPPLPSEDEQALLQRGRASDTRALRLVIESYLLPAAKVAVATAPSGMDPLDAIQRANAVLIALVEDPHVPEPGRVLEQAIRAAWDAG